MKLDVPTLLVVLAAMSQMACLSLMSNWLKSRPERHVRLWALALQIGALSCVLLLLRGRIPDWLSIGVANAGTFVTLGIAWNGARAFNGRRPRWLPVFIAPALWLISLQFPVIGGSIAHRVAISSVLMAPLSAALAWEIWARGRDALVWRGPFACVPAAHTLFLLVRTVWALTTDVPPDLLHGGSLLSLGILEPILMMFAATIIGLRLTDERLKNMLKRAASVDGLTGLLNHGAFMDLAREQVEQTRKAEEAVTLLLFDLDRFKQLNDRYGHAAGDAALKLFAGIVRQRTRDSDLVGRVGGEEFAALLVGCGADRGRFVAECIRADMASEPVVFATHRIQVTVSIGVMTVSGPKADFESLMVLADEALYAAKRGGRDLVFQAAS
ncbi:GGDEF domain-containing protein [Kaistia sp. 32K]|uniref:GGDEF domain-containing protein n=1 Tax=Kaistia sp. 32K TaxID=2795690 RepID=UPI001916303A|nr:GGDEF domain-containing protein [Kaistia sp. 32K]BCP54081.1 GGDEF domain-containing protein [Kaistia sp. 32K]